MSHGLAAAGAAAGAFNGRSAAQTPLTPVTENATATTAVAIVFFIASPIFLFLVRVPDNSMQETPQKSPWALATQLERRATLTYRFNPARSVTRKLKPAAFADFLGVSRDFPGVLRES